MFSQLIADIFLTYNRCFPKLSTQRKKTQHLIAPTSCIDLCRFASTDQLFPRKTTIERAWTFIFRPDEPTSGSSSHPRCASSSFNQVLTPLCGRNDADKNANNNHSPDSFRLGSSSPHHRKGKEEPARNVLKKEKNLSRIHRNLHPKGKRSRAILSFNSPYIPKFHRKNTT